MHIVPWRVALVAGPRSAGGGGRGVRAEDERHTECGRSQGRLRGPRARPRRRKRTKPRVAFQLSPVNSSGLRDRHNHPARRTRRLASPSGAVSLTWDSALLNSREDVPRDCCAESTIDTRRHLARFTPPRSPSEPLRCVATRHLPASNASRPDLTPDGVRPTTWWFSAERDLSGPPFASLVRMLRLSL